MPSAVTARSRLPHLRFGDIFNARIETLATMLRPSTTAPYRVVADRFLFYLQTDFPQLANLSELRRHPHLTGWFRRLCEQHPPLCNRTRQHSLLQLRRLFDDLAAEGHPLQPGLILREDFPPLPQHLPRALSSDQDRQLQQELRRSDDLLGNALLLTRATGIRIGECIHLALDCLRPLGLNQWALHVPLGKLHTERLVPVDDEVRQIVTRILNLRAEARPSHLANSTHYLLPRGSSSTLYADLRLALHQAAVRIDSSDRITPHRLRHTYASEMIRLGVSLPALMDLLGHKDIRMTLIYVQVTQQTCSASSITPAKTPRTVTKFPTSLLPLQHYCVRTSPDPACLGSHSPSVGDVSPSTSKRTITPNVATSGQAALPRRF